MIIYKIMAVFRLLLVGCFNLIMKLIEKWRTYIRSTVSESKTRLQCLSRTEAATQRLGYCMDR